MASQTFTPARPESERTAPARFRRSSVEEARREALAAAHADTIDEHRRQFGESYESALDRVLAEDDEIDRLIGDILARAAW